MKRIQFNRRDSLEILRYTSLNLTHVGDLWIEAWATDADVETFKLNGWWYELLAV